MLEFFRMKDKVFLFSIVLIALTAGCAFHRGPQAFQKANVSPLREARVFHKEKLAKGGNLLVVPFSAGEDVEASDELDHVSLMVVKGISDVLGSGTPFKVLAAQDVQKADFVIKGRVLQMKENNPFKPWGKKSKHLTLSLEGLILNVENEDIIAKFSQVKDFEGVAVRFEALAYEIGVEIGKFLLGQTQ